jgi:hypothetical protein
MSTYVHFHHLDYNVHIESIVLPVPRVTVFI